MTALLDQYDGVLLDLDGTAYRGPVAVPGATRSIRAVTAAGRAVGYVTNNAARGSAEVARHLAALGFEADPEHVLTSAQAAAALLAERLTTGDLVLVVGTEALLDEVRAVGLTVTRTFDDQPAAVVQGHSPDTSWADLAQACLAIRAGALWVACNVDPTLPTDRGELPGNGSMVAALRTATGGEPLVAGKPQRRLLDLAAARLGLVRPLVVGDRMDTDIAGGAASGMDTLLVLTGVSGPAELLGAPRPLRPTYLAADLGALHEPAARAVIGARPDWSVELADLTVTLGFAGPDGAEPLDALRSLCVAVWAAEDTGGGRPSRVQAADAVAGEALAALGLA